MLSEKDIAARISASIEIGTLDFVARGGFSKTEFYHMSFADGSLPKGTQWLGSCFIRSESIDEALVLSKVLEINPGGEVMFAGPFEARFLNPEYENRLLTSPEDLERAHNPAADTVFTD